MLTTAEADVDAQQYQWAADCHDDLGNFLTDPAAQLAAYRRAAKLADNMIARAGADITLGQCEFAAERYKVLRDTQEDPADKERSDNRIKQLESLIRDKQAAL